MDLAVWFALIGLFFAGGLTPGPAVMLVMSSSLRYGFVRALLPALGVSAANLVWITLAATGAGALAARFPGPFFALKLVGRGFIAWLAWTMATHDPDKPRASADKAPPRAALFGRGVGLQLANPNALVFFGALLPAYFDPDRSITTQAFIIMATVTATEMAGLSAYAWAADAMTHRFQSPSFLQTFNRVAAALMLGSAVFAVIATSR
ncbi:MAG: LysE family translocator [Pseudomonadota bacterium]